MSNGSYQACPLCGTDNSRSGVLAYTQEPWHLKQCRVCGMVYLENPPAYQQLKEDLAWEKTFAQESEVRSRRNPVLHRIGRIPKSLVQRVFKRDKLLRLALTHFRPGPILDVGCAGGHTLSRFPAEYIPYGIEISHDLSQIAATNFAARGGSDSSGCPHRIAKHAARGVHRHHHDFVSGTRDPSKRSAAGRKTRLGEGRSRDYQSAELRFMEPSPARQILVRLSISRPCQLLHTGTDDTTRLRKSFQTRSVRLSRPHANER